MNDKRKKKRITWYSNAQQLKPLVLMLSSGMILSNKKKNGKLWNTKSGWYTHVGDMRFPRRSRGVLLGGFEGMSHKSF